LFLCIPIVFLTLVILLCAPEKNFAGDVYSTMLLILLVGWFNSCVILSWLPHST
jgi:hypothetical protein